MTKKLKKTFSKKNIIMSIPAIVIGVILNWVSRAIRVEFDGDIFNGLNGAIANPALLLRGFPISINATDLLIGVAAFLILLLLIIEKRSNKKKYKKGVEHGSSKFGTAEDISAYINPIFSENIILSDSEFMTMESRPKDWKTARNKNTLVVGGSGSGKTRYVLKPNLMQMHSSYVITDPKGTIINELGYMFLAHGYKLKVLNLINLDKSMCYNPFAYVKKTSDILKLVETLMKNTSGSEGSPAAEDFWVKAERLLYQALFAAVFYVMPKEARNLETITEFLSEMETKEEDETFENSIDLWFKELTEWRDNVKKNPNSTHRELIEADGVSYAIKQYKLYKLAAGKTAKSILISCGARLAAMNVPEVSRLLSKDELNFHKLGEEKTALFVIIPDTDQTYNFIAAIMYTQLFNTLCTIADEKHGGRLPVHVRCLLDEFANIGMIPRWEKLIATIRSREISAMMVLQTRSQLKSIYKDDAETIIGNCDSEIFLGGKEGSTLKEISEGLGKETINDYNVSDSRGTSSSNSTQHSKLGRELMSIADLATMDRGNCIVQISGLHPFFSDKYDITKHPKYKYHASGIEDPKWLDVGAYLSKSQKKRPLRNVKHLLKFKIGDSEITVETETREDGMTTENVVSVVNENQFEHREISEEEAAMLQEELANVG